MKGGCGLQALEQIDDPFQLGSAACLEEKCVAGRSKVLQICGYRKGVVQIGEAVNGAFLHSQGSRALCDLKGVGAKGKERIGSESCAVPPHRSVKGITA